MKIYLKRIFLITFFLYRTEITFAEHDYTIIGPKQVLDILYPLIASAFTTAIIHTISNEVGEIWHKNKPTNFFGNFFQANQSLIILIIMNLKIFLK